MSTEGALALRIELDRGVAPVSGRVLGAGGAARSFAGWTELFAVLQEMIAEEEAGCD